jgi:copper transport protein
MKHLGRYDPKTHLNEVYKIPIEEFLPSGIAIDNSSNIWLTSTRSNGILLKYNPQTNTFTSLRLPTTNATTLGITIDDLTGQIWVAEDVGKIANIDPTNNFKVTEYSPTGKNNMLKSPTGLLVDPITGNIYISEHDGHAVSLFNPLLKTFKRFPSLNKNGLPFGMALDSYGNLWTAEHIINKVAVIDPVTGLDKEVNIPTASPFVQWITSDSKGNIWLAEQRGNSLAMLSSIMNPSPQNPTTTQQQQQSGNVNRNNSQPNGITNGIPKLGLSYADVVGPSVAAGIVVSALFYAKSIMDLKNSVIQANRKNNANSDK